MSTSRRNGKKGTKQEKPPGKTGAKDVTPSKASKKAATTVPNSKSQAIAEPAQAKPSAPKTTRIDSPAARKNAEMRWQNHYSAARKAVAGDDLHSAVLELQACVKFAEDLADYRLANSFAELGFVALKLREFETARSFITFAIGVRETIYGADDPSVAIEYNNLAMTYEWNGDDDMARPHLEKAVEILEKHGKFENANQAEPYEGLASICANHGQYRRAEQLCLKAIQIRDEHLGRLNPLSMKTVQFLSRIHEAAGNHSSASAASDVYEQRLAEYADSTSYGAAAEALKRVLNSRDTTSEKEKYDTCIADFLKLMARR